MISNFHICYYYLYDVYICTFIRCLCAVFGYKYFLTSINYFRQLYTIYGAHILIWTAIYYLRWLYTTFDSYILLLTLPDCDFVRIQDFITISCIYGLKARLDFNINLLALIQFCFFCSSMVSSIIFNVPF